MSEKNSPTFGVLQGKGRPRKMTGTGKHVTKRKKNSSNVPPNEIQEERKTRYLRKRAEYRRKEGKGKRQTKKAIPRRGRKEKIVPVSQKETENVGKGGKR